MKLLLLHLHSAVYKNLAARFKLPRQLHRLPPFPGQQIPIAATAARKKKVMKMADLGLTVEEIEMQGIRSVLLASPTAQLLQIIDEAAVFLPNILHAVLCIFHSDPTRRRVFVRGLPPGTTADRLREVFSKYGAVEEAEVAARDEGQGHVVFGNVEAVQGAIKAPGEEVTAALGGGCCRVGVEREDGDGDGDDDEERRRRRRKEEKIWLSGLGHVPLRRVMFVPIVYH